MSRVEIISWHLPRMDSRIERLSELPAVPLFKPIPLLRREWQLWDSRPVFKLIVVRLRIAMDSNHRYSVLVENRPSLLGHCAVWIHRPWLVSYGNRRFLQSIEIDGVFDPNTHVSSNLLPFRVVKLLIVLNGEVLSLYFLLDFLSLVVAHGWLDQATVNLFGVNGSLGHLEPSLLVMTILEFVA